MAVLQTIYCSDWPFLIGRHALCSTTKSVLIDVEWMGRLFDFYSETHRSIELVIVIATIIMM